MAGETRVNIISGFNDKGVNEAIAKLKGLGDGFKNITKQLIGSYVGFQGFQKGISFIRNSVDAARDLERNLAGLKTIFGDATSEMTKFAESGVKMGMSTAEAAKATTFIGSVMKQSGFAMKDNIFYTKQLVSLGADLAATYGYDVQEALTGMTALFRGEYDPIEKFGVAIKQQQVNTMLAEEGLSKLTGTQKLHAQQLARMILLFKATADVSGAYSRQQNTLAVAQQQLAATFTNMQTALGGTLIGPITTLVILMRSLTDVVGPHLAALFEAIGGLFGVVGNNASSAAIQIANLVDQMTNLVKNVAPILGFLVNLMATFGSNIIAAVVAFKLLRGVMTGILTAMTAFKTILEFIIARQTVATGSAQALAAAETEAAIAAGAANAAVAATPWGAIILAVALLGAGIVALATVQPVANQNSRNLAKSINIMGTNMADSTGKMVGYANGLSNLGSNMSMVSSEAVKAAKATEALKVAVDYSKANRALKADDIKSSKVKKKSAAEIQAENDLAAFKKQMKEMGLLGGTGDVNATKLTKAIATPFKTMVKDIQSNLAQVHDSIMNTFDITNMGTNGGSISRNIDRFMTKLREFAGYIQTLRGMSLNGALLQQLAMAGPEAGLAAAKAFAGDAGLVAQANAAYGELGMTSNAIAGNVVAAKAAPVYNINVNAGVGDKKTIGLAVVEAIKSYERTNGNGWRK